MYDRTKKSRTIGVIYTYFLSALWHGFYSGYYLTFMSASVFTLAGRSFRRHLRPLFLGTKQSKHFYDMLTCLGAKLSIAYLVTPFVLLESETSIEAYSRMYFLGHLISLFGLFLLPSLLKMHKESSGSKKNKGTKID